jgi:hypothetical protein
MQRRWLLGGASAGLVSLALGAAAYANGPIPNASYNFNSDAPASNTTTGGGYTTPGTWDFWQVQGGTDAAISLSGGIDTNGASGGGGDIALFASWTRTGGTFDYIQITNYYANPTNTAGGASGPDQVQVDFDIRIDGATAALPVTVSINQAGGYTSSYQPAGLVNGQYQHVTYLLSQATQGGVFSNSSNFNQMRFDLGNNFAVGSANTFHLDNFVLSVVPEPASMGIFGMMALGALRRRRN